MRPQHVTAVKAIAELSQAEVKGLRVGSIELEFCPKRIVTGSLSSMQELQQALP